MRNRTGSSSELACWNCSVGGQLRSPDQLDARCDVKHHNASLKLWQRPRAGHLRDFHTLAPTLDSGDTDDPWLARSGNRRSSRLNRVLQAPASANDWGFLDGWSLESRLHQVCCLINLGSVKEAVSAHLDGYIARPAAKTMMLNQASGHRSVEFDNAADQNWVTLDCLPIASAQAVMKGSSAAQ
jgi:hypothetical protein